MVTFFEGDTESYLALAEKDPDAIYFILDDDGGSIYKGNKQYSSGGGGKTR